MSNSITLAALNLSTNALETLEAAGVDDAQASADLVDLRNGDTREALLATCLAGAEGDDVVAGWTEYVDALVAHAAS